MSLDSTRPIPEPSRLEEIPHRDGLDEDGASTDEGYLGASREAAFLQSGVCLERDFVR